MAHDRERDGVDSPGDHREFRVRLEGLEERVARIEDVQGEKWDQLWASFGKVQASLENLKGRVAGYLLAAGLLGAVVAIIAQVAIGHVREDRLVSPRDIPAEVRKP